MSHNEIAPAPLEATSISHFCTKTGEVCRAGERGLAQPHPRTSIQAGHFSFAEAFLSAVRSPSSTTG
jgi:hypothetical protein